MLGPSMSEDSSRASSEVQTKQRTLPGAAANCCGVASGRSRSNTRTSFSCPAKLRTGVEAWRQGDQVRNTPCPCEAGPAAVSCTWTPGALRSTLAQRLLLASAHVADKLLHCSTGPTYLYVTAFAN